MCQLCKDFQAPLEELKEQQKKLCLWTGELSKIEERELNCPKKPVMCQFCKDFNPGSTGRVEAASEEIVPCLACNVP